MTLANDEHLYVLCNFQEHQQRGYRYQLIFYSFLFLPAFSDAFVLLIATFAAFITHAFLIPAFTFNKLIFILFYALLQFPCVFAPIPIFIFFGASKFQTD